MKKIQHECLSPLILENFILLYHAETGIATSVAAASAAFSRASSSETAGRIILCNQLRLLISHLLLLFHNIPHESMLSRRLLLTMPRGSRHSAFCVCKRFLDRVLSTALRQAQCTSSGTLFIVRCCWTVLEFLRPEVPQQEEYRCYYFGNNE